MTKRIALAGGAMLLLASACSTLDDRSEPQLRATMTDVMEETGSRGLAVSSIENGGASVTTVTMGERNDSGEILTSETIMYGASLTKTAFAYLILQLTDEGLIGLDDTFGELLPKPLPTYEGFIRTHAPYETLADDDRWREMTPRHVLTHSTGFRNFFFLTPELEFDASAPLEIHYDPGTRYMYSGDGFILLQFVLEQGLGLDVGAEMRSRVFEPLGMTNTDVIWREDFAQNLADGWDIDGNAVPHDDRSKVRMAGSMDTTIADQAKLWSAIVSCDRLSEKACAEFFSPHLEITTASQFPNFQEELPEDERHPNLAAGLGLIVTEGPQGKVIFKGGHNEATGNTAVCLVEQKRCVVILSNDVRSEPGFAKIVKSLLGDTGVPWSWEYSMFEVLE